MSVDSMLPSVLSGTGRYEVIRALNQGGMGSVFVGRQVGLDRTVAIKFLRSDLTGLSSAVRRFRQEAQITKLLTHPNTVRLYDFGETEAGQLFIVMEYLEGLSLNQILRSRGRVPLEVVTVLARQILKSLVEAHAYGIIHRDLKPSNVMVCRQLGETNFVKVLDFGIARISVEPNAFSTRPGTTLGTPTYMSPEQAAGHEVDARSDLYSLGATLFELAVGQPLHQPTMAQAQSLSARLEDAGLTETGVGKMLRRALETLPSARYPSAALMLVDLERSLSDGPGQPSSVIADAPVDLLADLGHEIGTGDRLSAPAAVPETSEIGLSANVQPQMSSQSGPVGGDSVTSPTDPTTGHGLFIGQRDTRAAVSAWLSQDTRLITLRGPPGVGKTRLAQYLLPRMAAQLGARPVFADLASVRTLAGVNAALARALGLRRLLIDDNHEEVMQLGRHLAAVGPTLIVLDNFEQVVSDAQVLTIWLRQAPEARFIVTSRQRLRLRGEVDIEVPPLAVPAATAQTPEDVACSDAVALFVDRARRVSPDFELNAETAPDVARITRRLDGLPLAIELAVARLRILTLPQLLNRLDERFRVLKGDTQDGPARHETLLKAIDWSWDLLTTTEQRVLSALSVFRGDFSLDEVDAVLAPLETADSDLETELESLRDKSLVAVRPRKRYAAGRRFFLYESIREYSAARCRELGLEAGIKLSHLAHFSNHPLRWSADGICARPTQTELSQLTLVSDNLVAAFEYACELDPPDSAHVARLAIVRHRLMTASGALSRHRAMLHQALDRAQRSALPAVLEAQLWSALAYVALRERERQRALQCADRGLELAETLGIPVLSAQLLNRRGTALFLQTQREPARQAYEAALALLATTESRTGEGTVRLCLANLALADSPMTALEGWTTALERLRVEGDWGGEVGALFNLGATHVFTGQFDTGEAYLQQGLSKARSTGYRRMEGKLLGVLGWLDVHRGRHAASKELLRRAIQRHREHNDVFGEATEVIRLATLELDCGRAVVARTTLEKLAQEPQASARLALAWLLEGRVQEACEHIGVAFQTVRNKGIENSRHAVSMATLGAMIHAEAGDFSGAAEWLRSAESATTDFNRRRQEQLIDIARVHVDLAKSTARSKGRKSTPVKLVKRIDKLINDVFAPASANPNYPWGAPSFVQSDVEVRLAMSVLQRLVEPPLWRLSQLQTVASDDALIAESGGRWFVRFNKRTDLSRSKALANLLRTLVARRLTAADQPLSVDDLIEAGWPDERMAYESGLNRVYVSVLRLRERGLGPVLLTVDDGYLLDPAVPLVVVPASAF